MGLKFSDINWDKRIISVQRTLIRSGSKVIVNSPKTKSSRRSIPISQTALELLKKQKVKQTELKLRQGPDFDDQGYIFTKKNGKPLQINNFDETCFYPLIKKANVKKIRFHDLRHTMATLSLEAGVNPKVISERLGHSSPAITLAIYSHVTAPMQEKATQTIAGLLYGSEKVAEIEKELLVEQN